MRRLCPALLLLVAACSRAPDTADELNQLDRELTSANATDPALADAIAGQIMADPGLQQQANANALRPTPRPDPAAVPIDAPLADPVDPRTTRRAPAPTGSCPRCAAKTGSFTLGALAAAQPNAAPCARISYAAGWANRLPADLPLYPGAQLIEAAGSAGGACRLRVVTFRTGASPAKVVNWYYTRATAARYSAEHQAAGGLEVLGGTRGADAYVVYVRPVRGGAEVDLITNAGS